MPSELRITSGMMSPPPRASLVLEVVLYVPSNSEKSPSYIGPVSTFFSKDTRPSSPSIFKTSPSIV